ncbi:MAG: hypothetical protein ACXWV0_01670 [Flavisolibacter sp.]
MKDHENIQPASFPGKEELPLKKVEEIPEQKRREQPVSTEITEKPGEAGSIPLGHDETIGIP